MSFRMTIGAAIMTLGLAAPAIAQEGMEPAPGQEKITVERSTELPKGQEREVTVTVKEVDPQNHKVTFEARVNPEAGGAVRLDKLQEGQQVRATFDPSTGEIISLEVLRPEPGYTPPATPPAE